MNHVEFTGNLTSFNAKNETTNSVVAKRKLAENLSKDETQYLTLQGWNGKNGNIADQLLDLPTGAFVKVNGFYNHGRYTDKATGEIKFNPYIVVQSVAVIERKAKDPVAA